MKKAIVIPDGVFDTNNAKTTANVLQFFV